MSDRHTPGPWFWEGGGISGYTGTLFGAGDKKVFDSGAFDNMWFSRYGPEDNANARLIAAAPDLLEAVEDALPHVHNDRVTDMMRAAIAKARGAGFAPRPDDVGQSDG